MLSSAFLFHGENSYMLTKELERRKLNFLQKYGEDAIYEFSAQNWDSNQIKQAIFAGGLFVSKKMVILYGVPKDNYENNSLSTEKIEQFFEDVQQNMQFLTPDTIVIFVAFKPDKRTRVFKRCLEHLQVKEFAPLKELQLKVFIREQLGTLEICDEELGYFLLKIGNDQRRLASEAQKLKIWLEKHSKKQVQKPDIDYYCFGLVEGDAFKIFDQLFLNPQEAVQTLEKMQEDGKSRNEVQGLLTWGIKIYLTLLAYDKQGIRDAKTLIALTKLHPFVVNKNLKHLPTLREHQPFLITFFKNLIDLEYAIKTGATPENYYRLALKQQLLKLQ